MTTKEIAAKFMAQRIRQTSDMDPQNNGSSTPLEIVGASFEATEDTIFGTVNEDYVRREIDWYNSKSASIYDMEGPVPQIWKDIAGTNGFVLSNYGKLHDRSHSFIIEELRERPSSRRAISYYSNHYMYGDLGTLGSNDFICTNSVQYLIRDEKLQVVVNMRSNDAVYGYKNDLAWQRHIANRIADELNLELGVGKIMWQVGSLHIYDRHLPLVDEAIKEIKRIQA